MTRSRLGHVVTVITLVVLKAGGALAQQPAGTAAPATPATPGDYSVVLGAEIGQRFLQLDGSDPKYRSDLNYEPGFRLFNFDTTIRPTNADGKMFDTFRVSAFGWGGDPSQVLHATAEKAGWYEADVNIRRLSYYNNLQNLALNQHTADTTRTLSDFNVTLFPASSRLRATFGYTAERDSGTTLSTYEYSRDIFQTTSPLQTSANDYRASVDTTLATVQFSILEGYRQFADNTTYMIPSFQTALFPGNSTVSLLQRTVPTTGKLPFPRASAHKAFGMKVDLTGRFVYTDGTTKANFNETVTGTNFSGGHVLSDATGIAGNATRPNRLGDFGVSWFVTDRLTIANTFRVNDFTIDGASALNETLLSTGPTGVAVAPAVSVSASTSSIAYRQFLNTLEVDYQFDPRLSAHIGYRYGNRRIEESSGTPVVDVTTNETNVLLAGFMARPVPAWRLFADIEHGTADNVFTRISDYDITNLRLRSVVKPRPTLSINASLVTKNNDNPAMTLQTPPQNFGATVTTRIATSSLDWTPREAFSLSAGYTYTDIASNAAILFFLNNVEQSGTSLYFMHDHAVFVNASVRVHPRVLIFAGYRLDKDTGQGDQVASSPTELLSSYPLRRLVPEARVTATVLRNVDWIVSWQHQDYAEQLFPIQDYRANVIYTSLRFRLPGTR